MGSFVDRVANTASNIGDRFLETGSAFTGNVFDAISSSADDAFAFLDSEEFFGGVGLSAAGVTPREGVPITAATERNTIPSTFVQPVQSTNPFVLPRPDVSESPNANLVGVNGGTGVGGASFLGIPTPVLLGGAAIVVIGGVLLLKK